MDMTKQKFGVVTCTALHRVSLPKISRKNPDYHDTSLQLSFNDSYYNIHINISNLVL